MTTRIGNRFALSQIATVAMAETRLAARATPGILRHLAPIVAWAAATMGLGAIVGFAAVVLPPLGAFGIVALVGVALLWVMPEAPLVYPALIRNTFFVVLAVFTLRPLLLHDAVRRPAVDLRPPRRRFRAYRAVPSCSLEFVRGSAANRQPPSRLVTDSHLCGWLSRYGDRLHSRIVGSWRIPVSFG